MSDEDEGTAASERGTRTAAGAVTYTCDNCGAETARTGAVRTETIADLDPMTWQTLCCPDCGARLQTVFVGDE